MAYMDQERKATLAPAIKAALAKYGFKGTVAVRHHSTLVINIREGTLDVIENYIALQEERNRGRPEIGIKPSGSLQVNPYWYSEHFSGEVLAFFEELFQAANVGNHNRSDLMGDYHDVGWYVYVNVGSWRQPYVLGSASAPKSWPQEEQRLRLMEAGTAELY